MAVWKKIALWFLVAVVAAVVGIYVFLNVNGRRLFNEQASSLTNRKVTVESIAPKLPAGVVLKGLAVEGLLKVRRARVDVDPLALLKGQVKILSAEIERPILFLERGADARLSLPGKSSGAGVTSGARAASPAKTTAQPAPVILPRLSVVDGEVRLKDIKADRVWVVDEIKGDVHDIPLTDTPAKTEFFVTASLARLDIPFVGHFVKAKGWLNWAARDMDASVQAVDDDGRVGLDVKLESKSDDLNVKGHVLMVVKQRKQASGTRSGMVENTVLGLLEASVTDIDADFSFRTTLDHFEIGEIALSGKVSSGLNSGAALGSIVDEVKSVGEELLKKDKAPADK